MHLYKLTFELLLSLICKMYRTQLGKLLELSTPVVKRNAGGILSVEPWWNLSQLFCKFIQIIYTYFNMIDKGVFSCISNDGHEYMDNSKSKQCLLNDLYSKFDHLITPFCNLGHIAQIMLTF